MALRVGVIGLGDVSMIHLHSIKSSEKAELVAVCDIDETKSGLIENVNLPGVKIVLTKNFSSIYFLKHLMEVPL